MFRWRGMTSYCIVTRDTRAHRMGVPLEHKVVENGLVFLLNLAESGFLEFWTALNNLQNYNRAVKYI